MTLKDQERELLGLERRYWQAVKDNDVETALRLTDDPCLIAGAQGISRVDKQALAAMMKDSRYKINSFELSGDTEVRFLRDDVAIIAYKVREELTVEGKPVTLEAADTSTWVLKNGRWVCALHSEAVLGDAFGRGNSERSQPE
ncbi:MAG: nuclear transport factor 2 family protein [Deltaproteobacteria bacterium]|nr:nuclear transport factor 2 family protein [Deltaproteobacteria bacterium]